MSPTRRRISKGWADQVALLARTLREAGVARYQDKKLELELELYPLPPELPQELKGSDRGDEEEDDLWTGSGAQPPNLRKLADEQKAFRSTG